MASIRKRGNSWMAQVNKLGHRPTASFATKAEAKAWALATERAIMEQKPRHDEMKRRFNHNPSAPSLLSPDEVIARATPLPSVPGIYFLMHGGIITYIGKSKNVLARMADHVQRGRAFNSYAFISCDEGKLDETERRYIEAFNPVGNKTQQVPAKDAKSSKA